MSIRPIEYAIETAEALSQSLSCNDGDAAVHFEKLRIQLVTLGIVENEGDEEYDPAYFAALARAADGDLWSTGELAAFANASAGLFE